jgi:hypothetical protein
MLLPVTSNVVPAANVRPVSGTPSIVVLIQAGRRASTTIRTPACDAAAAGGAATAGAGG